MAKGEGGLVNAITEAFIAACRDEIEAPKPGNVHVFADGHGMTVSDFLRSAEAAAPALSNPSSPVGARILAAVDATFAAAGMNTNLGIILLCAPIAHAALTFPRTELRTGVAKALAGLSLADAELAFKAISRANPGGLGEAPTHDVTQPARATLLEAMRAAADRDRIAWQYVNDFDDIFVLGLKSIAASRCDGCDKTMRVLRLYLSFLCAFPDSHIVRKFGDEAAERVLSEARSFVASLSRLPGSDEAYASALRFDQSLKDRGLNPGTSADLTVATLFADYVTDVLANACKNG